MTKNKLSLLAFSLITGTLIIPTVSCREGGNITVIEKNYALPQYGSITLSQLASDLDIVINENDILTSSDTRIASVVGNKIFASRVGTSEIEIQNEFGNTTTRITFNVTELKEYDPNEVSYINRGSAGGILIDLGVNRHLSEGLEYQFNFYTNSTSASEIQVTIDDNSILEYRFDYNNGNQYFVCKGVGRTRVQMFDKDANLVYRNLVTIVAPYETPEELEFCLSQYDYWGGLGYSDGTLVKDSTRANFYSGSGTMVGTDSGVDFGTISFNYNYVPEESNDDIAYFDLTNVVGATSFNLDYFTLFTSGDQVLFYTTNGLFDIYVPKMNS